MTLYVGSYESTERPDQVFHSGSVGASRLLGRDRIAGLLDRVLDLALLVAHARSGRRRGLAQLGLGLLLALGLALAGLGQRALGLGRGLAGSGPA